MEEKRGGAVRGMSRRLGRTTVRLLRNSDGENRLGSCGTTGCCSLAAARLALVALARLTSSVRQSTVEAFLPSTDKTGTIYRKCFPKGTRCPRAHIFHCRDSRPEFYSKYRNLCSFILSFWPTDSQSSPVKRSLHASLQLTRPCCRSRENSRSVETQRYKDLANQRSLRSVMALSIYRDCICMISSRFVTPSPRQDRLSKRAIDATGSSPLLAKFDPLGIFMLAQTRVRKDLVSRHVNPAFR